MTNVTVHLAPMTSERHDLWTIRTSFRACRVMIARKVFVSAVANGNMAVARASKHLQSGWNRTKVSYLL